MPTISHCREKLLSPCSLLPGNSARNYSALFVFLLWDLQKEPVNCPWTEIVIVFLRSMIKIIGVSPFICKDFLILKDFYGILFQKLCYAKSSSCIVVYKVYEFSTLAESILSKGNILNGPFESLWNIYRYCIVGVWKLVSELHLWIKGLE